MEASTMRLPRLLLPLLIVAVCPTAWSQSSTYDLGKAPSAEEIRSLDITISPSGKELPQGSGTAKDGAQVFARKCAACHGGAGQGTRAPALITGKDSTTVVAGVGMKPGEVMATHAPFATVIWDYINRAMPLYQEGSLKPDDVYSLTAFLLYKNGLIGEDDVLDAQSLPQVKMPNRNGYSAPDWKPGKPRIFP
jgi:S-disulfanyl-L-cysteine oxidoreductase SoxD